LEDVKIESFGKFTKVVFQSAGPLRYRDQASEGYITLFLTEPLVSLRPPVERAFSDLVEEIRLGYRDSRGPTDAPLPLESIVVKLKESADYTLSQRDWLLVMELKPKGGGDDFLPAPQTIVPTLTRRKSLMNLPKSPGLKEILQVGLHNHMPLRLAEAEYGLARLRVFEADRALLPSVSGRYTRSSGKLLRSTTTALDDIGFERREYGAQFGQPIFHSGRLYYSARQAAMQRQISLHNLEKVKAEATFDIIRAYNNLIKSQNVVRARRESSARANQIVELARKKKQLDLITPTEALSVESLYSQSYYRLLSDEKDLEIGRLKLAALLNVPELPAAIAPPADLDVNRLLNLTAPVEALIDAAMAHRPELGVSEYNARFRSYGEKAARAERRLKIDASGFYGKAGGAFEDEPLELRPSWNLGLQAGLQFGGNSAKGTGTREKTVPDFGETTATELRSVSGEVGLLDSLKLINDHRQAVIERDKALDERDQTRRTIEVDVRESYYNIQKARIQIKGAVQEKEFRFRDLNILRQKERMNLADLSQTMNAEIAYGEAVNNYEEALSFYRVSLAGLEKALGRPLDQVAALR
jgi:outer membrane protein TolC